ncbi:Rnf-Nqr domain containing protein [Pseudomonas citri]|uniref:Rnf-Nqr domain containing protein n=1 Tax=Pseudomonas citri TaxID=2978349 RepID=UPI0021B61FED|nr:Rnf-Nqr domain containing protein [Pseudomonas citri]
MNKPWLLSRGLLLVPLVGASDSLANALAVWLTWVLISASHGGAMGLLRARLDAPQRLLAAVVLAASLSACMALVAQAWALELYRPLNLYLGWIAVSCVVLEHQDFFVEFRLPGYLKLAGLSGLLMTGLGALRELIGGSVPLALLAPGGFILLGLLLAAHQAWAGARAHSPHEETPRP